MDSPRDDEAPNSDNEGSSDQHSPDANDTPSNDPPKWEIDENGNALGVIFTFTSGNLIIFDDVAIPLDGDSDEAGVPAA